MVVITFCTLICFWFQILCSDNTVCLWPHSMEFFCVILFEKDRKKRIIQKPVTKSSFLFSLDYRHQQSGPAESRYYESNEHEHPQKTSVGVIQIFDAIKQNFFIYPHTHISTENGKKMSTLRVPLCLRLHIKSRLRLSRWAK